MENYVEFSVQQFSRCTDTPAPGVGEEESGMRANVLSVFLGKKHLWPRGRTWVSLPVCWRGSAGFKTVGALLPPPWASQPLLLWLSPSYHQLHLFTRGFSHNQRNSPCPWGSAEVPGTHAPRKWQMPGAGRTWCLHLQPSLQRPRFYGERGREGERHRERERERAHTCAGYGLWQVNT